MYHAPSTYALRIMVEFFGFVFFTVTFWSLHSISKMKSESEILTGICTKVPLLSVGCENNGTTGTDPFLMNMGPCIGVTAESFWSVQKKKKKKEFAN